MVDCYRGSRGSGCVASVADGDWGECEAGERTAV